jgi:hypothetical protein
MLDEGYMQKVLNLFVSNDQVEYDDNKICLYLEAFSIADIIINVIADIDICVNRINKRQNNSPRMGSTNKEIFEFLNKCDKVIFETLNYLDGTNLRVITVDNN